MGHMTSTQHEKVSREVAAILARAAADAGITQAELAEKAGISQSQVSKLIRGDRQMRIDWLYDLAAALDLKVIAIVREAEEVIAARERAASADDSGDIRRRAVEAARSRIQVDATQSQRYRRSGGR